jgi:hypothetical protein
MTQEKPKRAHSLELPARRAENRGTAKQILDKRTRIKTAVPENQAKVEVVERVA